MLRTKLGVVLLSAISLSSLNAQALELGKGFDLALELTAVSDYRSKGISQSLGDPAIQAGASLTSPIGAYVGAWASSVDFGNNTPTRMEQDIWAGWIIPITEDFNIDVGWLKYIFPKSSELNSSIVYTALNYKGLSLGFQYSDDLNGNQSGNYTSLSYTYPVNESTRLFVRYAEADAKDQNYISANGDARDRYHDWEASIAKDLWGITWKASYVDTDMSKTECLNNTGFNDLCGATVVFGASKFF